MKRLAEDPEPFEQPISFRCHTGGADEDDVVIELDRPAS